MEKMEITRVTFINIYILYCTLSFNTIIRKVQEDEKERKEQNTIEKRIENKKKNKDKKGTKSDMNKAVNKEDFSKIKIEGAGIDLYTLMNDGFP